MTSKLNVLIVGAGKIGALFDSPDSSHVLTHAHAFSIHSGFNLIGFVDHDMITARKAAKKWGVKLYSSIKEVFDEEHIDVICIATSTESHLETIKQVSKYPIKLILLEKPIAGNKQESKKILEICMKKKIPVAVNYFRRYLPEFEAIKKDIASNKYGEFISGIGYYGKGMVNNGSHIINLLQYFFGEIVDWKVTDRFTDYSDLDETISANLTISENKKFILQGVNSGAFTLLEIDLIFQKKRLRIVESGRRIEFFEVDDSTIFKGYRNMFKMSEIETSFVKYMYFVVDNIHKHLTKGEKIKCAIINAYEALDVSFKLLKK